MYLKEHETSTVEQRAMVKDFDTYQQVEMWDLSEKKAIELLSPAYRAEVLGYAAFKSMTSLRHMPCVATFNTGMLRSLCHNLKPVIFVEGDLLLRKVRWHSTSLLHHTTAFRWKSGSTLGARGCPRDSTFCWPLTTFATLIALALLWNLGRPL